MDYEKKYNHALEVVRELQKDWASTQNRAAREIELAFPELRESEDEKIRRELIEYLRGDLDDITTDDTDRWVAYLEKQKEQKPVDDDPLNDPRFIDGFDTGREVQEIFDEPAEWSEEDENKIESIKGLITIGRFADANTIRTIWKLLDSLRPRPSWKPSEEQMSSLKQARDYYMSGRIKYVGRHLSEIVEQLEKL